MKKNVLQQYEDTYNKIVSFYDLAEALIDTVEDPNVQDPLAQLDMIEPVVEQIEASTDVLTEQYRHFVETGTEPDTSSQKKIEDALIEVYSSVAQCKNKIMQE